MPSSMRTREPVRIGIPISRPNCVSLSPSSALILMPMMEKIVHTAKHTVKAMVDMASAWFADLVGTGSLISLLRGQRGKPPRCG